MGATVAPGDAALRRERDRFDPYYEHMLLIDNEAAPEDELDYVAGVYRLMTGTAAKAGIGFYGATEYDLTLLTDYPGETLELGRSCVAEPYRGGAGMHLLWTGLGRYVAQHGVKILFGVASFHGRDPAPLAQPLAYLHHNHLAPENLRVRALDGHYTAMDLLPPEKVDRAEALRAIPALIKAYIRLGGHIGDGAFVDHEFNTVDVCLLMDTENMVSRYQKHYSRQRDAIDKILH
jgi:putative hemolysin